MVAVVADAQQNDPLKGRLSKGKRPLICAPYRARTYDLARVKGVL